MANQTPAAEIVRAAADQFIAENSGALTFRRVRKSGVKFYVYHVGAGTIVLDGASKTEATKFARSMDKGRKGKKRFAIAPTRIARKAS